MVSETGDQDVMHKSGQGSDARHEKICVSVRLRPLNEKEIQSNDFADWECINNTTILFKNCLGERSMYPNAYSFDRVFGNDCSTKNVYEEAAKEVALSVLNGINSSVFAYGQTSSGKTFTMSGITQYAVTDIYDYIEKHKEREFVIKFSAMEIYNENVRDLLSSDPSPLRCLDDPERGTVVERVTEEILTDKSRLLELIAVCEAQRQTGETCLNETSSRSHQILRLTIESSARQFGGGNSSMLAANVNFVDLAGSERTSQTLATGTRLKEGSHINRSLLTLGKVIRSLSKGRNGHVPYRDSKLTRILHNSLGGNARTAIICTMSPAHSHLEQSRNTLLFASCAKEVSTNARVNVVMSDKALVKQLKKELAKLEGELKIISSVSNKGDVTSILKEKEIQIEKMEKEMKELSRQRDVAQSRVEELLRSTGRRQFSRHVNDASSHHKSDSRDKLSWLDDSSVTSDSSSDYQRLDVDLTTSDSFQNPDEHNDIEYSTERSDVLDNNDHRLAFNESSESSPHLPPHATLEFTPMIDEDMEDNCKEVHCIEVEETSINKETKLSDPSTVVSSEGIERENEKEEKNESPKSEYETLGTEKVIATQAEQNEETVTGNNLSFEVEQESGIRVYEVECEEPVSENESVKSSVNDTRRLSDHSIAENECTIVPEAEKEFNISPEIEQDSATHVSIIQCEAPVEKENVPADLPDGDYEALVKRIKELQKTIDCLVNRNPLEYYSPCSMESERWSSRGLNLSRSRSCKAALSTIPAIPAFEKMVQHHRDQSFGGFDKLTVSERPKGLPRASDVKDGSIGNSSRLSFPSSIRTAITNELEQDVKHSDVTDSPRIFSSVADPNENANDGPDKHIGSENDVIIYDESESKYTEGSGSAREIASYGMQERDCMSEGTPSSVQSPVKWGEEFEITQFRIIELWHTCHIPLVHRTYFYLLFKGDPSDKLYLEVELRRLSFIKKRFDQGQKIVMDGQIYTPSSSIRALNQEREMLMKQIYKKFPVQERESLFERWGITMSSKQRRLQLSRCLWSNTKDMEHIRDSASLVAKLVGFVDDGQVPKEMFVGPSLTPKTILNRRSYSWK